MRQDDTGRGLHHMKAFVRIHLACRKNEPNFSSFTDLNPRFLNSPSMLLTQRFDHFCSFGHLANVGRIAFAFISLSYN